MTLASHARGPEFEPRCEYYQNFCEQIFCHPEIFLREKPNFVILGFFFPKHIYFAKKKKFHTEHAVLRTEDSQFVLGWRGFGHDTSLYYGFITQYSQKGVEMSHTSFFKTGWECVAWPLFALYMSDSANRLMGLPKWQEITIIPLVTKKKRLKLGSALTSVSVLFEISMFRTKKKAANRNPSNQNTVVQWWRKAPRSTRR